MSFLDNLEDNLKSLESREDAAARDKEDRKRRDAELAAAQASAPWADQLRTGPFTAGLLDHATRIGHTQRTKVHIAWMGTALRLEARGHKLELKPTADGVMASFFQDGVVRTEKVDLTGDPEQFAAEWLTTTSAHPTA